MIEQGSPTVQMSWALWSEIWMNKCAFCVQGMASQHWGGWWRGEKLSLSLLLCFQRQGQMQFRPPWTPQLDLLCQRGTGSGRAPPLLLLNMRALLALDTEQTLTAQTNPCHAWTSLGQRSCGKRGVSVAWPKYWLIFLSGCQERVAGPFLVIIGRGQATYQALILFGKVQWGNVVHK